MQDLATLLASGSYDLASKMQHFATESTLFASRGED